MYGVVGAGCDLGSYGGAGETGGASGRVEIIVGGATGWSSCVRTACPCTIQ